MKNLPVRLQLSFKGWVSLTTALLLAGLSGCDSMSQLFPNLPTFYDRTVQQSPPQSQDSAELETQVWQQINDIRAEEGLSPLQNNQRLAQVARDYSQKMADQNFFSHTSPAGDTMVQRVGSAGIFYLTLGENLFKGTNISEPSSTAVQGWMDSPGHRANILKSDYRETGIGVWQVGNTYYFTQLFMRSL